MKNILITGASSGIGKATAEYLDSQGYNVILTARNEEKLIETARNLSERAKYIVCDISNLSNTHKIFDFCTSSGIKLDGLVYCAGIAGNMPVRNLNIEYMQEMMKINCFAFADMVRQMASRKYSAEGASIVALSSLSAITCYSGTSAYSMSKSALNSLCSVLSKELARRKITVNTLMPGYVRTPMTEGMDELEEVKSQQPFGFIEPIEIAYVIEFLLSEKARSITGACIPISGGMNF